MPSLFNKKILEQRIKNYSVNNGDEKLKKIKNWQNNLQNIKGLNEISLQNSFLKAIFEQILGYENAPQKDEWTMEVQCSTDIDAKLPDGILGFYKWIDGKKVKEHKAVIELKGPQVSLEKDQKRKGTTYKSPVDQAFSYTNKLDGCRWVIVSNFIETRLYKVGRSKEYYEVFHLDELGDKVKFKKFHYLISRENLITRNGKSQTMELSETTHKRHEDISVEFYNLYKDLRINLFEHLKRNNSTVEQEILLEKAQKFLDRIIFICFCEDKGLLPNDLLHEAIERGKKSFNPSKTPIWDQIRGVFKAINRGSEVHNINRYDGGLFEKDDILDNLIIDDDFFEIVYDVSDYDFDSDLDVNILGHIFEQSIADIEKIKSEINENKYDENKSKRKKDGIYYTPKYITNYIVKKAVGGYLEEIKDKLGYNSLPDISEAGSKSWKTRYSKQHLEFYNQYEEKLKEITILDPACGSGAFLNQAFDYLLEEHQWLNKQRDILKDRYMSIDSLESLQKNILKENLFGVDLNEESVEITKLSLWLKTANKNKPLTNLDDNIKCGNSLINDSEIADKKAFNWEEEFPEIINKGGFDIVIGNPPYVSVKKIKSNEKEFFKKNYFSGEKRFNLFTLFLERGLSLLNDNGFLSYILPENLYTNVHYYPIRKYILENTKILFLSLFTNRVFDDAAVDTSVIGLKKSKKEKGKIKIYRDLHNKTVTLNQGLLKELPYNIFPVNMTSTNKNIIKRFLKSESNRIKDILEIQQGIIYSGRSKKEVFSNKKEDIHYKKILDGRDITKWALNWEAKENNKYILYDDKLHRPREERIFLADEKLLLPRKSREIKCAYDDDQFYALNTAYICLLKDKNYSLKYILSCLNSKLVNYYYHYVFLGWQITIPALNSIPIKDVNFIQQKPFNEKTDKLIKLKEEFNRLTNINFNELKQRYASNNGISINQIIKGASFSNLIYSGRARKIREFTVNINTNIVTIYSDKSTRGRYELLKFEENNSFNRKFVKYHLENLTEKQLQKIDRKYEGNLLKKVLQINIPDFNKKHVIKKVVVEWENILKKITNLEKKIKEKEKEIDRMIYELYELTDKEIDIVEKTFS